MDDLVDACGKLWEHDEMPLIVATSKMIKNMRNYSMVDNNNQNIADVINKVKELENSFMACLKDNSDQLKTLSEIVHNNIRHSSSKPLVQQPANNSRVSVLISENEKRDNGGVTPPNKKRKACEQPMSGDSSNIPGIQSLSNLNKDGAQLPLPPENAAWSTVAAKPGYQSVQTASSNQIQVGANGSSQTPRPQRGAWRKSLNLLHGTADSSNTLAADVSLVAYGVAKDATTEGLKSFLEARGVAVIECVNLTTFQFARTHSYKVTIKASQYDKAIKPEVWPFRVGVRLFKQFRNRDNDQQASWDAQVRNAAHSAIPPVTPQVRTETSTATPMGIETSNRFGVLASGGPSQRFSSDH